MDGLPALKAMPLGGVSYDFDTAQSLNYIARLLKSGVEKYLLTHQNDAKIRFALLNEYAFSWYNSK